MSTVYLDLDGVLTDLNGMLAKKAGVPREEMGDATLRTFWINKSTSEDQVAHWRDIPPNRVPEFRAIMSWLQLHRVNVEILTSYGIATMGDCGALAHAGKVKWLMEHYLTEFQDKMISRFNGAQECWQKQFYAMPGALLVDDQPENCEGFRAAGGRAILYDLTRHDDFVIEFERTILEMS